MKRTGSSNFQQMIRIFKVIKGHLLLKHTHSDKLLYEIIEKMVSNQTHTFLMSSRFVISGDSPPCTHRNCWFISAAKGRQSKASIHASYTLSEYLILPVMGGNRAGRGEHAKSNNTALIHWGSVLDWDGKGSPKCQKTSQTHFKNSTISQRFCVCFFSSVLWLSPTEIVVTCVNIKKGKNLTEFCSRPEGTFKWAFEVGGWTGRIINSF